MQTIVKNRAIFVAPHTITAYRGLMTTIIHTANIHESPTGRWHITDNALPYLDERGQSYPTERAAIRAARASGEWTHRVTRDGKVVRL